MKLKKFTAIALSLSMCFGTSGMASAQENINDQFFKDYENLTTWEKVISKSQMDLSANVKSNEENMQAGYNIKVDSKSDVKNVRAYMDITLTPTTADMPEIPNIKVFVDKTDLYLNKEAANAFAALIGSDKKFTKDFVKINTNANQQNKAINDELIKTLQNNPTDISKKLVSFFKKIDLGIDTDLKKDGNTYSISWDANKTVDLLNGYIKFILNNPDYILDFYKDVFGIDITKAFKEMGISSEEYKDSAKEANKLWIENVEPVLPAVKEAFKGTVINYSMTFNDDNFISKLNCIIKLDASIIAKKLEVIGGADKKANAVKNSINYSDIPKIEFTINSTQDASKSDSLEIKLPESFEVLDMDKLVSQPQTSNNNQKLYVVSTTTNKISTISPDGKVIEKDIKISTYKNNLYLEKQVFEQFTNMKVNSNDKMFQIRPYAKNHNLGLKWMQSSKQLLITQK